MNNNHNYYRKKTYFPKLKEDYYTPPKPYVREPLNAMDSREQAIFDAIVSASTKGMKQKDIERIVRKALTVAFDPNVPSILRMGAKGYYQNYRNWERED